MSQFDSTAFLKSTAVYWTFKSLVYLDYISRDLDIALAVNHAGGVADDAFRWFYINFHAILPS